MRAKTRENTHNIHYHHQKKKKKKKDENEYESL
jgi:hypothetical protein